MENKQKELTLNEYLEAEIPTRLKGQNLGAMYLRDIVDAFSGRISEGDIGEYVQLHTNNLPYKLAIRANALAFEIINRVNTNPTKIPSSRISVWKSEGDKQFLLNFGQEEYAKH